MSKVRWSRRAAWTTLVALAALSVTGVALWRYGFCRSVETGSIVDCPRCGVVLAKQVRYLRVPRWEAARYRVDREQRFCERCGSEVIRVTVVTTTYCPKCGKAIGSSESTGEVARKDEQAWRDAHAWQRETCRVCSYNELMDRGRDLYMAERYAEAKATFQRAAKVWPEAGDAQRWLRDYDKDLRAQARQPKAASEQVSAAGPAGGAEVCSHCGGTGIWKQCPRCGGRGVAIVTKGLFEQVTTIEDPCSECFGAGMLICPFCRGTGKAN